MVNTDEKEEKEKSLKELVENEQFWTTIMCGIW